MASPWNASAWPTSEASAGHRPAGPRPAVPLPASGGLPGLPARPQLTFRRTTRGDAQVRDAEHPLPSHIARLLLLFEGPQSVDDLRRMIDEPWLPEALIELQRRRLIERSEPRNATPAASAMPAVPAIPAASAMRSPADLPERRCGTSPLEAQRDWIRVMFLRQLGTLGSDMGRRILQCRTHDELEDLMPQVDALVEAIAGRDALARFREQTVREH